MDHTQLYCIAAFFDSSLLFLFLLPCCAPYIFCMFFIFLLFYQMHGLQTLSMPLPHAFFSLLYLNEQFTALYSRILLRIHQAFSRKILKFCLINISTRAHWSSNSIVDCGSYYLTSWSHNTYLFVPSIYYQYLKKYWCCYPKGTGTFSLLGPWFNF